MMNRWPFRHVVAWCRQFTSIELLGLVAVSASLLMLWGAWEPYSYWVDEIFSVSAARESFSGLFRHWILIDVHPPLYPMLLKLWVDVFGFSEAATRSLSLLAGVMVIAVALRMVWARRGMAAYAILLLALPWFVYYSQETRPYVFLYLLGLIATLAAVQRRQTCFLVTLVVMAWVHYFGLLFGLALVFAGAVLSRRLGKYEVLAVLFMLAWLPLHLALGDVLSKATGGFWIKVSGPGETLANFLGIISPGFQLLWRAVPAASLVYAVLTFSALCYFPFQAFRKAAVDNVDAQLALGVLCFLVGVMIIDSVVPMSTARNFLVAMPAFFYVLYRLGERLLSARNVMLCLMMWVLVQLPSIFILMQYKHSEFENYRGSTIEVLHRLDSGYQAYYLNKCQGNQGYNSDALNNLYMSSLDAKGRTLPILCLQNMKPDIPRLVLLACLQEPIEILQKIIPSGYVVQPMDQKGLCSVIRSVNT